MSRRIYLEQAALPEALERWFAMLEARGARGAKEERVPVDRAHGRITARDVTARRHSPHFLAAAMDGIAVESARTAGARDTRPLRLGEGSFVPVDTGDPLPPKTNAVIMEEDVHWAAPEVAEITRPASPWQHVRPVGEDLVTTAMIVPVNHRIGAFDLGGFLAGGVLEVWVRKAPRVMIVPTGSEMVSAEQDPGPGILVEYNSQVFSALLREWGADPVVHPVVPDDIEALREALRTASQQADLVIVNAGSSAGREDYTHAVVESLGEVAVHGLAIRPGKPALLGAIGQAAVAGLPGYPVSAALACELLVKPWVERFLSCEPLPRASGEAVLSRPLTSPAGVQEYVRVSLGRVGDRRVATPLSRGAGLITSLIRADGLLVVPPLCEGYEAGETVTVEAFRPWENLDRNILSVGSHDLTQDVLGSLLRQRDPGIRLSSVNTGSFGGIMALRRGEAHLAGIHILDPDSGEYNRPALREYLAGVPVVLVNLVYRSQGLLLEKGNPAGITGLEDVARRKIPYVNRQKGSGTRILLDQVLRREGIAPGDLEGYALEEYTHLGVGTAILAGQARTGLGIYSAAHSLGLDFLPLYEERYDLAVRRDFYESELFAALLSVMRGAEFAERVGALGGYSTRDTGRVFWEQEGGCDEGSLQERD